MTTTNTAPTAASITGLATDVATGRVTGLLSVTDADQDPLNFTVPTGPARGTVVLDLEPQAGLDRFTGRDRIEGQSLEFHQRVRQGFLGLAAADPDHYVVLDARAPVEEIAAAIQQRLAPLLERA